MRYLTNENDTNVFKASDSSETIRLSARNDNNPVTWDSDDVAKIHIDKDNAHVKDIDATLITGSNNITFSTSELADLPAGDYELELWTKLSDGVNAIWPSQGMLSFTIDRNADSLEGGSITTITLDDFKKQLSDAIEDVKKNAVQGEPGPAGKPGENGHDGKDGKSAYQIALDNGFKGTEQEWLKSLENGPEGPAGKDGKSAYQEWLDAGNKGTQEDFLASLKGQPGPQGQPGKDGATGPAGEPGPAGKPGENGHDGKDGKDGRDGASAYQVWIDNGNTGTEQDFLNSLKGPKGDAGANGKDGSTGPAGQPGKDGKDGVNGRDGKNGSMIYTSTEIPRTEFHDLSLVNLNGHTLAVGDYVLMGDGHLYDVTAVDASTNYYSVDSANYVDLKGVNGQTPYIGSNDNWFIGGYDTGVRAKAQDATATKPTNGNWNYSALSSIPVVHQKNLTDFFGMDGTHTYVLDTDKLTLNDTTDDTSVKLSPAIYLLRDHGLSNFTIKADEKFGRSSSIGVDLLQLTVTPYAAKAVFVDSGDVYISWRENWSNDTSPWYGVTDKWHVLTDSTTK